MTEDHFCQMVLSTDLHALVPDEKFKVNRFKRHTLRVVCLGLSRVTVLFRWLYVNVLISGFSSLWWEDSRHPNKLLANQVNKFLLTITTDGVTTPAKVIVSCTAYKKHGHTSDKYWIGTETKALQCCSKLRLRWSLKTNKTTLSENRDLVVGERKQICSCCING